MQRDHLDRALSIWGDQAWYKNQFSRSSFLKGKHLMSLGGDDIKEGKKWVQRALQIRREIVPNDQKSEDELDIGDFDELVVFWSRWNNEGAIQLGALILQGLGNIVVIEWQRPKYKSITLFLGGLLWEMNMQAWLNYPKLVSVVSSSTYKSRRTVLTQYSSQSPEQLYVLYRRHSAEYKWKGYSAKVAGSWAWTDIGELLKPYEGEHWTTITAEARGFGMSKYIWYVVVERCVKDYGAVILERKLVTWWDRYWRDPSHYIRLSIKKYIFIN
jgi:hypothetical protein